MKEERFTLVCPICSMVRERETRGDCQGDPSNDRLALHDVTLFLALPGSLNTSSCCKKPICSECYLQIRPPRKTINRPFCNHERFTVLYTPLTPTELTSTHSVTNGMFPRRSSAIGIPKATETECTMTSSLQSVQYASVEDRDQIRDSLCLHLSISDKPVTNSPHPNRVAALNDEASRVATTPADAARLEELMLLEAIRWSMQDISVEKNDEERGKWQNFRLPTIVSGGAGEGLDCNVGCANGVVLNASQLSVDARDVLHYPSSSFTSHFRKNAGPPVQSIYTPSWYCGSD
uniref:Uncharacterized protein n=1 Tax=Peronospora matthiolae TaxID=2874970 RepID=A0AAV1T8C2_9STRA